MFKILIAAGQSCLFCEFYVKEEQEQNLYLTFLC